MTDSKWQIWQIEEVSPQHFLLNVDGKNALDLDLLPALHHLSAAQRRNLIGSLCDRVVSFHKRFDENSQDVFVKEGEMSGKKRVEFVVLSDVGVAYSVVAREKTLRYYDPYHKEWKCLPDGEYLLDNEFTLWKKI